MPLVKKYESPVEAARACGTRVLEILEESVAGGRQASFAISGGSTPKLMFDALAAAGFDWTHVHLFWVDERCVPPDDEQSNYKLAKSSLIDPARIPAANVHRVCGELPPDEAAAKYAAELRAFFAGDRLPALDVIHCGMGPDAHTASLFPGDERIYDRKGIASSVFAPKLPNWRVTLLPGVLLAARHTLMLVTGADKAETLRQVMQGTVYDPFTRPVQLLQHEGRKVTWFLDRAAAADLEG